MIRHLISILFIKSLPGEPVNLAAYRKRLFLLELLYRRFHFCSEYSVFIHGVTQGVEKCLSRFDQFSFAALSNRFNIGNIYFFRSLGQCLFQCLPCGRAYNSVSSQSMILLETDYSLRRAPAKLSIYCAAVIPQLVQPALQLGNRTSRIVSLNGRIRILSFFCSQFQRRSRLFMDFNQIDAAISVRGRNRNTERLSVFRHGYRPGPRHFRGGTVGDSRNLHRRNRRIDGQYIILSKRKEIRSGYTVNAQTI